MIVSPRVRCTWILLLLGFCLCTLYICFFLQMMSEDGPRLIQLGLFRRKNVEASHQQVQWSSADISWIAKRLKTNSTSLANWLLSQEDTYPPPRISNRSTPYLILVWEHGLFLERRHLKRFSSKKKYPPWENCSVNNCQLTYDSKDLDSADAVIFHLHLTRGAKSLPKRRNFNQRWIFLTDESPINTFIYRGQRMSDYNGIFNWSMTYRMNSDVPVPYGRTVLGSIETLFHKTTDSSLNGHRKLVAILGSNCSARNNRWKYVKELKRILGKDLTIMGHCLGGNKTVCPGHFNTDCPVLGEFKFYLSFENSNCREYLTEKVFWNAYEKHAVPVIMGAPRTDCQLLLPPDSYLHVEDFADPSALASYLLYLHRNNQDYEKLHAWRSTYRVINEHGYFGSASKHYCRVCQALNYNSPEKKVYNDLQRFWDTQRHCSRPVDS